MAIELEFLELLLRLGLGIGIGFLIGLTGVGGGSIVVPVMVQILQYPIDVAVATANLFAFLTKITAIVAHWRLRTIDWRAVGLFLLGAVPGDVLACYIVTVHVTGVEAQTALSWFVVAVIIGSLLLMIYSQTGKQIAKREASARLRADGERAGGRLLGIFCGFGVGVLLGATSVGGAIVVIPLLVMFFSLPVSRTVGTSIAIALALTLVASLAYSFIPRPGSGAQPIRYASAILMAVASIPGVYLGSRLTKVIPERHLGRLVTAIMILAAGMLITDNILHLP